MKEKMKGDALLSSRRRLYKETYFIKNI